MVKDYRNAALSAGSMGVLGNKGHAFGQKPTVSGIATTLGNMATGGGYGLISGLFGGEDHAPFQYPRLPKVDPTTAYQRFSAGADYARRVGRTGEANYLTGRASKYGDGGTPYTSAWGNPDGSARWESLGPGGPGVADATAAIRRGWKEQLTRYGIEHPDWHGFDEAMHRKELNLSQDTEGAMKQGLIAEIDPSLQKAQAAADANLGTSAIDAGTEAAIRSRFVAAAKQDSATSLARIGAGIGLGNTANSPAAAALAQADATAADSSVTSGLRDMSIQATQMNRDQRTKDIELATRIAGARYNLLNGNSKSIIDMQGDVGAMIDALYSRKQTLDMNQQQLKASTGNRPNPYVSAGIGLAGAVAAPFTGGASIPIAAAASGAYNNSYRGAQ